MNRATDSSKQPKAILAENYPEKVYAGWLGKCIGVRLGAPVEGWTYQQIQDCLGEITDFTPLPHGTVFRPDDDTSLPLLLIRAFLDHPDQFSNGDEALETLAEKMGDTWLNSIPDGHGVLWWGGVGISTEHTAFENLKKGLKAPDSGSMRVNGKTNAEQIGGQIFSEVWGLAIPGDPEKAANYARRVASVSHDGEGLNGAGFIAALTSLAFVENDPVKLVESARKLLPKESDYHRVVSAILEFYFTQPEDWRSGYQYLKEHFGYHLYPGNVHIIPNAGVCVLALLYGKGDFNQTVQIAVNAGWDTDCNAGSVGAIMGVAAGLAGIDHCYRAQLNDCLITSGLSGARNLVSIHESASWISQVGYQIAKFAPAQSPARGSFPFQGTTSRFEGKVSGVAGLSRSTELVDIVSWQEKKNDLSNHENLLQAALRRLLPERRVSLFVRTYYNQKEMSGISYQSGFSPLIYPGQMVRAQVRIKPGSPSEVQAGLYVRDKNADEIMESQAVEIAAGKWRELAFEIPSAWDVCLSEVGIFLEQKSLPRWDGAIQIKELDWSGNPSFGCSFAREIEEYGALSQFTYLRGCWKLERHSFEDNRLSLLGVADDPAECYTGDVNWLVLSQFRARIWPLKGEQVGLLFRAHGALHGYLIALSTSPDPQLQIYKKTGFEKSSAETPGQLSLAASAPFQWAHNHPYDISVKMAGNIIQASVHHGPTLETVDPHPIKRGQVGFFHSAGGSIRIENYYVG
jgi:ADP-ribosylglycohydrolase